jgi:hypothetical protein
MLTSCSCAGVKEQISRLKGGREQAKGREAMARDLAAICARSSACKDTAT